MYYDSEACYIDSYRNGPAQDKATINAFPLINIGNGTQYIHVSVTWNI